jgi:leucyl aminopeptidase
MLDMKCDMSGAAGMVGVAMYLDTLDALPVELTVAIGLTENMTGGSAFRPLDIYKAYNGTTVEIHHTDAEGRLVLADVMSYVEDVYHVDHLITMATLTGACIHALGHDIAGIMGDDEDTIRQLLANTSPYESVWRLPLNEKMKKALKADIADLKNIARSEKAGSSEGGAFLTYFQGKAKLTHLDIAGPAYRETVYGYMPKGGTGWGVKVLSEFLIAQSNK